MGTLAVDEITEAVRGDRESGTMGASLSCLGMIGMGGTAEAKKTSILPIFIFCPRLIERMEPCSPTVPQSCRSVALSLVSLDVLSREQLKRKELRAGYS